MTTIAVKRYDDRIEIAGDTLYTSGNTISQYQSKLIEDKKYVIGLAGNLLLSTQLAKMVSKKKKIDIDILLDILINFLDKYQEKFEYGDACIIIICKKTKLIYLLSTNYTDVAIINNQESIGSGSPMADTALHIGKTPAEAVKIASEIDIYTGGEIETITLKL